ncbi:MAG: hypothetical protein K0R33_1824 [Mycobacterium sp.]|nr:hypothetical protein [Mycobacterium sp.]
MTRPRRPLSPETAHESEKSCGTPSPRRRPGRHRLAPGLVAPVRRPACRPADRALLDRPGGRGRARVVGLRHHRGRAGAAIGSSVAARPAHRPGPRARRCRADRGAGSTPDTAHRADSHGHHHPHRTVPPVQGDRHARLRQQRPGRRAGADIGQPRVRGTFRARGGRRRAGRGRRLCRGAAPAVGQLGG